MTTVENRKMNLMDTTLSLHQFAQLVANLYRHEPDDCILSIGDWGSSLAGGRPELFHSTLRMRVGDFRRWAQESSASTYARDLSKYKIDQLELSTRSENCLRIAGIETLEDLAIWTRKDLLKIKGFGRRSLNEITDMLHDMGLTLKPDGD